jgi:hypothetical protein
MGGQDSASGWPGDLFCSRCRSAGHMTKDCRRGQFRSAQQEVERELPLSEYIAPICAAQLEGQAFFCIPDRPSEVHTRERSTTAVITVLKGVVTTR